MIQTVCKPVTQFWFQHPARPRQWWLLDLSILGGGVQVARVDGEGVQYVCPPGCEDDCEEWESGSVAMFGEHAADARRIFTESGAAAVLDDLWTNWFDL